MIPFSLSLLFLLNLSIFLSYATVSRNEVKYSKIYKKLYVFV